MKCGHSCSSQISLHHRTQHWHLHFVFMSLIFAAISSCEVSGSAAHVPRAEALQPWKYFQINVRLRTWRKNSLKNETCSWIQSMKWWNMLRGGVGRRPLFQNISLSLALCTRITAWASTIIEDLDQHISKVIYLAPLTFHSTLPGAVTPVLGE